MLEEIYRQWMKSREGIIQPIVKEKLNILLKNNPAVEKVYLAGSYLRGDWIDENTDNFYVELKAKVIGKKKISDVDFVTEPPVDGTEDYDIITSTAYKLLIYDNGTTKI